jgi:hypothetical protein
MEKAMRLWKTMAVAFALMIIPTIASAQYKDLDAAMSSLTRGFGNGDAQAIVSGIAAGDQVMLQFPGLADQTGLLGRDQAAYLLDGLFNKVHPTGFEQRSAKKISAEGQYYITASWTVQVNGRPEARDLYITLKSKNNGAWSVVSIRSGSK